MPGTLRRCSVGLLALCMAVGVAVCSRADVLQPGDLVAVCGDSITEQKDYSVNIEVYLLACRPAGPVRTVQFGWNGDTARLFIKRGVPHVLTMQSTVATTCFGMNDAGFQPIQENRIATYRDSLTKVVQDLKAGGVRLVVVGSPGVADSDNFKKNPEAAAVFNKNLAVLRDVAREVAEANDCLFANVHDAMMDAMVQSKQAYGREYHLAGSDGVHPWDNGHLVMSYAFLKAMGFDGDIGTFDFDLATGRATATDGHKVLEVRDNALEIESTRYPFCFWGAEGHPRGTRSILPYVPFNQDLNRLILRVRNLPSEKARVTWGDASREFTAAQLSEGINLAAEFLDNPFSKPFLELRAAVRKKQEFETRLYKVALSTLPELTADDDDPATAEAIDTLRTALLKKDAKLAADLVNQVTPVQHKIVIEAVQ